MNDRPYITCRELIEFLYLYLSGELPADRVAEFERHLSVCPSCVEYIASYRETVALAKRTLANSDQPVGDLVPEELVTAILTVRRRD
jgi:predicted anti-sigma-YlaC factor YlaD